jgi:hypothetical protein
MGMAELATADQFVLYAVLIVAAMAALEWFEARRGRVGAAQPQRRARPRHAEPPRRAPENAQSHGIGPSV